MVDIMNRTVKTPTGDAPVVPIIMLGFGAYLTWFGIHYWRSDTAWPSDPIKAVLTGKAIPVPDSSSSDTAVQNLIKQGQDASAAQSAAIAGAIAGAGAVGVDLGAAAGAASGSGGTLSKAEIMSLWTSNGGASSKANLAAAVAMQESSGRTGVTSDNPDGGKNVGLWQLDTKGVGAGHSVAQLQDAATNARITIMATANGTNWSRWAAYTTGAYKKYL